MSPLRWSRWGLLSFCWTASVWAADGDDPAALFTKLDANNDGNLTVEEVSEEHRPHFERLLRRGDKDENKVLTKDEFLAAHTPDAPPEAPTAPMGPGGRGNPGEIFERMDANKDGKLQKSEIPEQAPEQLKAMLTRTFERAGKDELSREELMRSIGEGMRGAGGAGGPGEMLQRLKGLDKNGDGKVSKDEFPEEGGERLRGLMERLGGGDSIDLKKAEEFASRMEREGGPRPEGRPDGERRPGGPEGRGPDGERRGPREGGPDGRPDGDRPRPEGDRPRPDGDREMSDRRGPDGRGPEGPGRGGLMRLLDENHDGRLSRQEFSQAATFFAELDMNRDGSIDPSELLGGPGGRDMGPDGRGPRPEGDFRRDGDRPGPDGERMRDGDRPGPRGEGDRGPEGDRPRPDGEGRPGGRPDGARFGNPDEFWKQLDKNGDGGVTKEEAPERMRENFDTIDANKDGKITQDEAREAMERRFGGRGPGGPGGRPGRPEGERRPARPEGEEPKPAEPK